MSGMRNAFDDYYQFHRHGFPHLHIVLSFRIQSLRTSAFFFFCCRLTLFMSSRLDLLLRAFDSSVAVLVAPKSDVRKKKMDHTSTLARLGCTTYNVITDRSTGQQTGTAFIPFAICFMRTSIQST